MRPEGLAGLVFQSHEAPPYGHAGMDYWPSPGRAPTRRPPV